MENNAIKIINNITELESAPDGGFYKTFGINFFDKVTLEFHGMSTGCGIMQCRGIKQLYKLDDSELEIVKDHLLNKFNDGYTRVGIIIGTLGPEGYYNNSEQHVLKAGFIRLTEYNNWYDTKIENTHIARVYGLKLNFQDKKNV